jgi:membrane protease YdiL (CAAX protease family)
MCQGFVEPQTLVPGFFILLLAGVILGLAYQRTGDLFLSIGLHAGWIFWLKFYGVLTIPAPGVSQWLWGSDKLIDGWVALGVLLPVLLVVASLKSRATSQTVPREMASPPPQAASSRKG